VRICKGWLPNLGQRPVLAKNHHTRKYKCKSQPCPTAWQWVHSSRRCVCPRYTKLTTPTPPPSQKTNARLYSLLAAVSSFGLRVLLFPPARLFFFHIMGDIPLTLNWMLAGSLTLTFTLQTNSGTRANRIQAGSMAVNQFSDVSTALMARNISLEGTFVQTESGRPAPDLNNEILQAIHNVSQSIDNR